MVDWKKWKELPPSWRITSAEKFYKYFRAQTGNVLPSWRKLSKAQRTNWVNMPNPSLHDVFKKVLRSDMPRFHALKTREELGNKYYYNLITDQSPTPPPPVGPYVVSGWVANWDLYLPGAHVQCFNLSEQLVAEAYTDDQGKYSLPPINSGEYFFKASKDGYHSTVTQRTILENTTINFSLSRETEPFYMYGYVRDKRTNDPLKEVKITLISSKAESKVRYTDRYGHYIFNGLEEGNYTVHVEKEGYIKVSKPIKIHYDVVQDFELEHTSPKLYRVYGTITNQNTSQRIEGAKVQLIVNDRVIDETSSSNEGYYSFAQVSPNSYKIKVQKEGYSDATKVIVVSDRDVLSNFTLEPLGILVNVDGTITSKDTHEQIFDATIQVYNNQEELIQTTRSHRDGDYVVRDIPKGQYKFIISHEGYISLQRTLVVSSDMTQDFELEKEIPLGYRVEGFVTNELTEEGVSAVKVVLMQEGRIAKETTTDWVGKYWFDGVLPGEYTLQTEMEGYEPTAKPLWIQGDMTQNIVITPKKVKLTVNIREKEGHEGLAAVVVDVMKDGRTERSGTTDSTGQIVFHNLISGQYKVVASKYSYDSVERNIEILNEDLTLDLEMENSKYHFSGIVMDGGPYKEPTSLPGATVLFGNQETVTDEKGEFEFSAKPGEYDLTIKKTSFTPHTEKITLNRDMIVLKSIQHQLIDFTIIVLAEGTPLKDANVRCTDDPYWEGVTDDEGKFIIQHFPVAFPKTFVISKESYEEALVSIEAPNDSIKERTIDLGTPGYKLSGTVKDIYGNNVKDAVVRVGSLTRNTDATGSFEFDRLYKGSYHFSVEKSPFFKQEEDIVIDQNIVKDVILTDKVKVTINPHGVQGIVPGLGRGITSDPDIYFEQEVKDTPVVVDLLPGWYGFAYIPNNIEEYNANGFNVQIPKQLYYTIDIEMDLIVFLDLTFVYLDDDQNPHPIEDTTVHLLDSIGRETSLKTDSMGHVIFHRCKQNETYRVSVDSIHYDDTPTTITTEKSPIYQQIEVQRCRVVEAYLKDWNNMPIQSTAVHAIVEGADKFIGITNSGGRCEGGILSGFKNPVNITTHGDEYFKEISGTISIEKNKYEGYNIELIPDYQDPTYKMYMDVEDVKGNRIEGAEITVYNRKALTDNKGEGIIHQLQAETKYPLSIYKEGYDLFTSHMQIMHEDVRGTAVLKYGRDVKFIVKSIREGSAIFKLLEGAEVTLDAQTSITNAQGVAEFSGITWGEHNYSVVAEHHTDDSGIIEIPPENIPTIKEVTLTYSDATVLFKVTNKNTGVAILGVKIYNEDNMSLLGETDQRGLLEVALPPGNYNFLFQKEGFVQKSLQATIQDVGDYSFFEELSEAAAELSVAVYSFDESSIVGAEVSLENSGGKVTKIIESDTQNEVTFTDLAKGAYTLTISCEGFIQKEEAVLIETPSQRLQEVLRKSLDLVKLKVKDADSNIPLVSVFVRQIKGSSQYEDQTTDNEGCISLENCIQDDYQFKIKKEGYETEYPNFTFLEPKEYETSMHLPHITGNLEISPSVAVGSWVEDVMITIENQTNSFQDTKRGSSEGSVTFTNIPMGQYKITAVSEHYLWEPVLVTVDVPKTVEIIGFESDASLTVTCRDAETKMFIQDCTVTITHRSQHMTLSDSTSETGVASFPRIMGGIWDYSCIKGTEYSVQGYWAFEGGPYEETLLLPPAGKQEMVTLPTVDKNGDPLDGVEITLSSEAGYSKKINTSIVEGKAVAVFEWVPYGNYHVKVHKPASSSAVRYIDIEEDLVVSSFDPLRTYTIHRQGRCSCLIIDEYSKEPIEGVEVNLTSAATEPFVETMTKTTDEEGIVTFGCQVGVYDYVLKQESKVVATGQLEVEGTVDPTNTISIFDIHNVKNQTFKMIDAMGFPIFQGKLTVKNDKNSYTGDINKSDGTCRFSVMKKGNYSVTHETEGTAQETVTVSKNDESFIVHLPEW